MKPSTRALYKCIGWRALFPRLVRRGLAKASIHQKEVYGNRGTGDEGKSMPVIIIRPLLNSYYIRIFGREVRTDVICTYMRTRYGVDIHHVSGGPGNLHLHFYFLREAKKDGKRRGRSPFVPAWWEGWKNRTGRG